MDKEYIERDALLEDISESVVHTVRVGYPSPEVRGANKVIDRIKAAPTADVVEVVRCKDCLFSLKEPAYEHGYMCYKGVYHPGIGETRHRKLVQDCDFCSYGKRKKGAENDT